MTIRKLVFGLFIGFVFAGAILGAIRLPNYLETAFPKASPTPAPIDRRLHSLQWRQFMERRALIYYAATGKVVVPYRRLGSYLCPSLNDTKQVFLTLDPEDRKAPCAEGLFELEEPEPLPGLTDAK